MSFGNAILVVPLIIALTGCGNNTDPFAVEKFERINSTFSLQIVGEFEKPKTGLSAIISPSGMGTFHYEGKTHKLGRGKQLYSEVTSLLGPLQNYSGNFEGVDDLDRKMECGNQSNAFQVALIFWQFDPDPSAQKKMWQNVSQFDLTCDSKKSRFATKRIESAIRKFKDHVERTK
jgi:hypothetical protein